MNKIKTVKTFQNLDKRFLIYGILSFLIFRKICDILSVLVNISSLRFELSNVEVYFILVIFVIILPIMFFIFYIKRIRYNFWSLIILSFLYILSYSLLYYLNNYLGRVLNGKIELNIQSDFLAVRGWSEMFTLFSEVILLLYLVAKALKKEVNSNSHG
ncbi:MAG: hypothetical protein CVT96_07645 [Bacteroidetes bacterium HGW-Bacteroidetes-13]|nr:MAG: hypothetical protein CVT96_07645 [Bacteroidetes bacterium HGW-Bacteroidetes-13]